MKRYRVRTEAQASLVGTRGDELIDPQALFGRTAPLRLEIGFGHGEWADEIAQHDGSLDIAYRPVINDFRGRQPVEVHLVDWRPAKD